jgi:hypothetical protein
MIDGFFQNTGCAEREMKRAIENGDDDGNNKNRVSNVIWMWQTLSS